LAYLRNLRDHLNELERRDLLVRVKEPVNKDTEMHALVRLQFRGLPAEKRRGFLFETVTDARGRKFDTPVAVGIVAGGPLVYHAGLLVDSGREVAELWERGLRNPIPPKRVESGPVQEVVVTGDALVGPGKGLDAIPIPVSTPGFDPAPYLTAGHWHTKDVESGILNVGNYRGMVKASNRTGVYVAGSQHIGIHWEKCRRLGKPLEAAVVIGVPPVVSFCAVAKIPYGVDELAVAGGMAGEPLPVVRCRTVDIDVPAQAEYVIEGRILTDCKEIEGPFGEYHGYMAGTVLNPVFEITAITHREKPIWVSFLSQYPPSESSQIRAVPNEQVFLKFLRDDCGNPAVKEVVFPQYAGALEMIVISLAAVHPSSTWKALNAAVAFEAAYGKIVVAVDEDVNPRDAEAIWWAITYHTQPHRDFRITRGKVGLAPYSASPTAEEGMFSATYPDNEGISAIMIDATRKWAYPPISLPPKQIMEHAVVLWDKLGLPPLQLGQPWFGQTTTRWPEALQQAAARALQGDYHTTGEKRRATRTTDFNR
jgi:UbiD family decarboxylase